MWLKRLKRGSYVPQKAQTRLICYSKGPNMAIMWPKRLIHAHTWLICNPIGSYMAHTCLICDPSDSNIVHAQHNRFIHGSYVAQKIYTWLILDSVVSNMAHMWLIRLIHGLYVAQEDVTRLICDQRGINMAHVWLKRLIELLRGSYVILLAHSGSCMLHTWLIYGSYMAHTRPKSFTRGSYMTQVSPLQPKRLIPGSQMTPEAHMGPKWLIHDSYNYNILFQ